MLEIGDLAIHDEEAFPEETFAERIGAMAMAGDTAGRHDRRVEKVCPRRRPADS